MIRNPETQYQKIYLGRDNPFTVSPTINGVAVDFLPTRAEIRYKTVGIDSSLYDGIFNLATVGTIGVNIKGLALEVGEDTACELILYSADYPSGVVVEPLLELVVTDAAQGDGVPTTPLQNISLDDLADVSTAGGSAGDVLTQQADGSFAMAAPTGGSGTGGGIDETLSDDHSYSGVVSTVTVGEAVVFGDILYRNPTSGDWHKAQANAVLTIPGLRMAMAASGAGDPCLTLCSGLVRHDAWVFTADGSVVEVWLSASVAGGMTESVDTTEGCFGQVIGTPLASNILEFRPMLPVARF